MSHADGVVFESYMTGPMTDRRQVARVPCHPEVVAGFVTKMDPTFEIPVDASSRHRFVT